MVCTSFDYDKNAFCHILGILFRELIWSPMVCGEKVLTELPKIIEKNC
jgi:hypothetical protein